MQKHYIEPVKAHPSFKKLIRERRKLALTLTIMMLFIYFSFILTIAFAPEMLSRPLFVDGVVTVGIPWGIGVIVSAFILTGVYVRRANTLFDHYTHEIHKDVVEI